ncbi:MAG: branched-chain amino acid ABC transporter ATP-binding protein [Ignavibacteriae bacterium HGW-Ignavibacteriae-2]|jgi:branched-chain amino acid transport system ATP-binding protein|nr:MAG: branched-chain amino acid ABC transporter ATP-binding protein [Ignavibacteriae bacterium HGW-Ignavibacteriae-2]
MLVVNKLNMGYKDLHVLWDVTFNVDEGQIVVLVGSNGAGKSSILKTISGLQKPLSGVIDFAGEPLSNVLPEEIIKRGIVHIPEGRRLFNEMTVEENLLMGSLHGEAKKRRKNTIEEVCDFFPRLKERYKQNAGTLSGGEQQMLAVARGLMSLPKLLMLDEPSLGLAPFLVQEIFDIIKKINEQGITILLVEQNVQTSLTFCNRAYVLENGRIVLSGTGKELLHNNHVKSAYLGL